MAYRTEAEAAESLIRQEILTPKDYLQHQIDQGDDRLFFVQENARSLQEEGGQHQIQVLSRDPKDLARAVLSIRSAVLAFSAPKVIWAEQPGVKGFGMGMVGPNLEFKLPKNLKGKEAREVRAALDEVARLALREAQEAHWAGFLKEEEEKRALGMATGPEVKAVFDPSTGVNRDLADLEEDLETIRRFSYNSRLKWALVATGHIVRLGPKEKREMERQRPRIGTMLPPATVGVVRPITGPQIDRRRMYLGLGSAAMLGIMAAVACAEATPAPSPTEVDLPAATATAQATAAPTEAPTQAATATEAPTDVPPTVAPTETPPPTATEAPKPSVEVGTYDMGGVTFSPDFSKVETDSTGHTFSIQISGKLMEQAKAKGLFSRIEYPEGLTDKVGKLYLYRLMRLQAIQSNGAKYGESLNVGGDSDFDAALKYVDEQLSKGPLDFDLSISTKLQDGRPNAVGSLKGSVSGVDILIPGSYDERNTLLESWGVEPDVSIYVNYSSIFLKNGRLVFVQWPPSTDVQSGGYTSVYFGDYGKIHRSKTEMANDLIRLLMAPVESNFQMGDTGFITNFGEWAKLFGVDKYVFFVPAKGGDKFFDQIFVK